MQNIEQFETMSMLELPDDERAQICKFADTITAGFGSLEHINTDNTQPLVTVLDLHSILREDISEKRFQRDDILANAPEQYDGYFQVPGTLE